MSSPAADRAAALAAVAREGFPKPWSPAQFAAELDAAGSQLWTEGEAPDGYLLGHRVADELEIRSLAVAAARRRHGVARRLLARALAEADAQGVGAVHLEVGAENRAARALYARAGFVPVGRRPGYYAHGEDALRLRRDRVEAGR